MTALASGAVFTDINDHWSKEFVENMYTRNITKGYGDATFRPDNSITNLEVIVMVANMLGYEEKGKDALDKHKVNLNNLQIPGWAQGYVAYLVEEKVLLEKEVASLVVKDQASTARRYEVANYIGRVLVNNAYQIADMVSVVPYKDALSIPSDSMSYISILLKNGILSKDSNDGRFLPNNQISRGEVAKLISLSAEILDNAEAIDVDDEEIEEIVDEEVEEIVDEDIKDDIEKEPSEKPGEETKAPVVIEKEGTINNIFRADRTVITLKDEKGKETIYDVKENAIITVDGKNSDISKLAKNQNAKIKLVDGEIEVVTAINRKADFNGYFIRFLRGENTVLTLKDQNGNQRVFVVPADAKIYLDDMDASLSTFKEGDVIKIYYKGENISSIEGKGKTEYVRGSITNKGASSQPSIEITTKDEKTITIPVETNTTIIRDGRKSTFSAIKIGDEVNVELEYEKMKTLTASIVKRTVEGTIKKLTIGEDMYLSVENKDGIREDFLMLPHTVVIVGGDVAEIYDLRYNNKVTINIESNEVVRVNSTTTVESGRVLGYVSDVRRDINMINVRMVENGIEKEVRVNTKSDTIFIGVNGSRITLQNISLGHEVLIIGTTSGGVFVAERVVIIN